MKGKLNFILLALLLLIISCFTFGCTPTKDETDEPTPPVGPTVYEIAPNDIWSYHLKDIKAGDTILLTDGKHDEVDLTSKYEGVYIKGTEDALIENFNITANNITIEDLTICGNVDKLTGIICLADIENLTVKNCLFMDNGAITNNGISERDAVSIKNLVVDGCVFEDVADTAIRITKYNNLTIKNCTFDGVGYNAMQVGEHANAGEVKISNNIFDRVKSRVVYLVRVDNLTSCTIENNIFFNHHGVYVENESLDTSGKRKTNGVYICTKSTTENKITVGINNWVNIPEDSNKYISTPIDYNPSIQLQYSLVNN